MAKAAAVLLSSALGVFIGAVIACLIWAGFLWSADKGIGPALRGEVEDAIGALEGLLALGGIVGLVVGLNWGLSASPTALPPATDLERLGSTDEQRARGPGS
jgi:hypothetical protein